MVVEKEVKRFAFGQMNSVKTIMPSVLSFLESERIFNIRKDGDLFKLTEECDSNFEAWLTKLELLGLAEELKELAES